MGGSIDSSSAEKHLGNTIGNTKSTSVTDECIRNFLCKFNMVNAHFGKAHPDVKYHLFKTFCMPLYGIQLHDLSGNDIDRFYCTWRKCIRRLLGIPNTTHCSLLPYICDDIPVNTQLYIRCVKFIRSLHLSPNPVTNMCYKLALHGSRSNTCKNINHISSVYRVSRHNLYNLEINNMYPIQHVNNSYASIVRDMLDLRYRRIRSMFATNLSADEINDIIHYVCTC